MTSPPACPRFPAIPAVDSALAPIGRNVTRPQMTPASVHGTHAAARARPPGTRVWRGRVGAGPGVSDDWHGTAHRMSSAVLPPQRGERTVDGTRSTASAVPSLRDPSRRMDATTLLRDILREGVDQFRRSEAGQFWRASKHRPVVPFWFHQGVKLHAISWNLLNPRSAIARRLRRDGRLGGAIWRRGRGTTRSLARPDRAGTGDATHRGSRLALEQLVPADHLEIVGNTNSSLRPAHDGGDCHQLTANSSEV